jgi:hypothetical protein
VRGELGAEDGQGAAQEADAAVRVVAGAAPFGRPGPAFQVGADARARPRSGQLGEAGGDAGQPVEAGTALPGEPQQLTQGSADSCFDDLDGAVG